MDNDPHKLPAEAGRREEERRKKKILTFLSTDSKSNSRKTKKRKQTKPQNLHWEDSTVWNHAFRTEKNTGITSSSDLDNNNKTKRWKQAKRHRTRRENTFKLLTNHKAKRSKTNFSPVFHRPASKKKNESMICKKSVEDVVRTKSLTSFVNLENRAKDDDDSSRAASAVQAAGQEQKRFERKFRFHETSKLLPQIQRGKKHKSRAFLHLFFLCVCFVFFLSLSMSFGGSRLRHSDDYGGCERREEERVLRHHHRSFVAKERERE